MQLQTEDRTNGKFTKWQVGNPQDKSSQFQTISCPPEVEVDQACQGIPQTLG